MWEVETGAPKRAREISCRGLRPHRHPAVPCGDLQLPREEAALLNQLQISRQGCITIDMYIFNLLNVLY
jgi:hypothetical protein